MPLHISRGLPTLFFRRDAYERANLSRAVLDERLRLTDQEFRVEGDLIAVGPIYNTETLGNLIDELEAAGLTYFDDFFEMSGGWPEWLDVLAIAT